MGHFIDVEQRYLNGEMNDPESESFLEPEKITPSKYITVHIQSQTFALHCTIFYKGNKWYNNRYSHSPLPVFPTWRPGSRYPMNTASATYVEEIGKSECEYLLKIVLHLFPF